MTAVRVYVATTDGPSEIQRIAEEDPEVRSVVCLNGTSEALPISAAYDAFVRKPTGVVERLVGHPVFRMDVATRISDGRSWQLAAFVAHALLEAGRLAQRNDTATQAIWLTGTVDSDLRVGPVDHIAEKLQRSRSLFESLQAENIPITVFLPKGSADQGPSTEAFGGKGIRIVPVENTDAVCRHLGLPRVTRGAATGRNGDRGGRRRAAIAATLVLLAMGAAGAVQMRGQIGQWLEALWPARAPHDNGGQAVNLPVATDQPNGTAPLPPSSATPVSQQTATTLVSPSSDAPGEPTQPSGGKPPASVGNSPSAKPQPADVADQPSSSPDTTAPEPSPPPQLKAADIKVSAFEWRAPGGRSCAVADFGTTGPIETPIGTASSGRFAVSSAQGLCAVSYRATNEFTAPVRLWLYAAPMGVRKHFGATVSALESRLLKSGETLVVELKLPRWVNEPVSYRVFAIATAQTDAEAFVWLDRGMAAIKTSFDFGRWADLRLHIQKSGMTLVSAIHEVNPR